MSIRLTADQLCRAASVEMWNMSLFGKPQATIICGNCTHRFKTRDYNPLNGGGDWLANCPHCNKWNRMNIRFE